MAGELSIWPVGPIVNHGEVAERKTMIDRAQALPVKRQVQLAGISRGSVYYRQKSVGAANLALMRRIDELHLEHPFMGTGMLRDKLDRAGSAIGRKRVGTLMKRMGVEALHRKPNTSKKTIPPQDQSLSVTRAGHRSGQSGLGSKYDLSPHGQRVCLSHWSC